MQNLEEKNKTHHKNKHYNKNKRSKFGMRFVPRRQRIIVFANVGHELLRKLTTRIKLSKISDNSSPNEVIVTTSTSAVVVVVGFGRIKIKVNVESVFE
jgi:hypothetical protein